MIYAKNLKDECSSRTTFIYQVGRLNRLQQHNRKWESYFLNHKLTDSMKMNMAMTMVVATMLMVDDDGGGQRRWRLPGQH